MRSPFIFDYMKPARHNFCWSLFVDGNCCTNSPGRDTQMQWEGYRIFADNSNLNRLVEWIISPHLYTYGYRPNLRSKSAGSISNSRQTIIGAAHPEMGGKLRPTLVH